MGDTGHRSRSSSSAGGVSRRDTKGSAFHCGLHQRARQHSGHPDHEIARVDYQAAGLRAERDRDWHAQHPEADMRIARLDRQIHQLDLDRQIGQIVREAVGQNVQGPPRRGVNPTIAWDHNVAPPPPTIDHGPDLGM